MKIAVKLHGILRDYRPAGAKTDQFEIELSDPAVVRQTVEHFGIPPQRVHAVFVNGVAANLEIPLHDGDQVRLFPPVVGGTEPWCGACSSAASCKARCARTAFKRKIIGASSATACARTCPTSR